MMRREGVDGEISYDLVMKDDMDFVEGTCRVDAAAAWHVFVFKKSDVPAVRVTRSQFPRGANGVVVHVPISTRLDRQMVERTLSESFAVQGWREVAGPDSMTLR